MSTTLLHPGLTENKGRLRPPGREVNGQPRRRTGRKPVYCRSPDHPIGAHPPPTVTQRLLGRLARPVGEWRAAPRPARSCQFNLPRVHIAPTVAAAQGHLDGGQKHPRPQRIQGGAGRIAQRTPSRGDRAEGTSASDDGERTVTRRLLTSKGNAQATVVRRWDFPRMRVVETIYPPS